MNDVALVLGGLAGVMVGAFVAIIPGLHIYNLVGLVILVAARGLLPFPSEALSMSMIGLVVGWSVINVIPAVFLFAPDDTSALFIQPATKFLLRGDGIEAALLIGAGSIGALVSLVVLSPLLDEFMRPIRAIVQPHLGWILVAICGFLVLSEWPRGDDLAPTRVRRLLSAWSWLGAGLLTFVLSGALGFVLLFRSPIPIDVAFTNLLPAFVGLFAVPNLIQVILCGAQIPVQRRAVFEVPIGLFVRGTLSGVAGGLFASFLPVISGGVGGLLAGHATAQRDERIFLVSQGASKVAYYAGSLLLLFVPGLTLTRGGMSWMLTSIFVPYGWRLYSLAIAVIALGGILAFWMLLMGAYGAARIVPKVNVKWVAIGALAIACAVTLAFTGLAGIAVLAVASLIGLIPVFVGGRRMNGLGVLLIPMTLNFVGIAPAIAGWLGLV